jgi:hypothetical protein
VVLIGSPLTACRQSAGLGIAEPVTWRAVTAYNHLLQATTIAHDRAISVPVLVIPFRSSA